MARRKSEAQAAEATEAPTAAAPKGRNNLIPAVVLAVGLAAGGYLFSSGGKSGSASAAPATGTAVAPATPPTTVPEGEIVKLDATTLNLADAHFLKLGLGLQLKKGVKPEAYTTKSAKALDLAISLFGGRTYTELSDPKARDRAKEELSKEVTDAYGGEVTGIYFTEFVMQ